MDGFLLSLYAAAGGFTTSNRLSPGRRSQDFDPCSLCGERRTSGGKGIIKDTFQFTLSLRRATANGVASLDNSGFQSTLSLRRATATRSGQPPMDRHFNPRSPCGERLYITEPPPSSSQISIHALLAESDAHHCCVVVQRAIFQSTLSLRRATCAREEYPCRAEFQSTLSLRRATGSHRVGIVSSRDFNPRSPCGERPAYPRKVGKQAAKFQSTLSLRRATLRADAHAPGFGISIHALLAESDL